MTNEQKYLKISQTAVLKASEIFTKYYGRPGKVEIKYNDPRNLVTQIDLKIEKLIRGVLMQNFPEHKMVGEELENQSAKNSDYVWYIDPIDGTANYIHGLPFCCISVALWDSTGPVVGIVFNPILNLNFTAVRGGGAFCNNKKISVSKQENINKAYGGYGWGRNMQNASRDFPQLVKHLNKIRTLGSTAMEVCMVAKGIYDFHLQAEISVWDFAAAILILQEAGGSVTDWQGKKVTAESKSLITTNKQLHKQLVNVLNSLNI